MAAGAGSIQQRLAYRPATQFWPGHATITLSGDLTNARPPHGKGKSDAWGRGTVSTTFKTARALVINLDGRSDQGYATIDGKKVKRFGISLGRPGFTTDPESRRSPTSSACSE